MLKWFGHLKRMGEERLVKRVYWANVEGNRGRGRDLSEREGVRLARDRDAWSGMVYRLENGEEKLGCEVHVAGKQLKHVLNKSGTDVAEVGAIWFLVSARGSKA